MRRAQRRAAAAGWRRAGGKVGPERQFRGRGHQDHGLPFPLFEG